MMDGMNQVRYQMQWPPFSKSVIGLTVFFFLFWLVSAISEPMGEVAVRHFALSLDAVKENRIYTVLTYAVWHRSFFEVLFTGIAIWLFGAELEKEYGKVTWWGMLVGATLLGGAFVLLLQFLFPPDSPGGFLGLFKGVGVTGMHAGVMAFVTAYCLRFWTRRLNFFFIPMTGKTMLLFFLALSVVMSVFAGAYTRIMLDLAGVIVGVAVAKRLFNLRDVRTRFAIWRARRHLKVVKTPESKRNGKMNGRYTNGHDKPN